MLASSTSSSFVRLLLVDDKAVAKVVVERVVEDEGEDEGEDIISLWFVIVTRSLISSNELFFIPNALSWM